MKSLNTQLDGKFCSDIICEGNWVCQYWKPGGKAMIRCVARWDKEKWTKIIDWHDDDVKELDVSKDDFRPMHGPPNAVGLDIIGIIYFADKPVRDFEGSEKCF